jgi:predicted RNase H-like HicB family nuclease
VIAAIEQSWTCAFVACAIAKALNTTVDRLIAPRNEPMKLKVLIHAAEEGGFWAEVPAFPGCVSEGETLAETKANIKEAAEGWLEIASKRMPDRQLAADIHEIEL